MITFKATNISYEPIKTKSQTIKQAPVMKLDPNDNKDLKMLEKWAFGLDKRDMFGRSIYVFMKNPMFSSDEFFVILDPDDKNKIIGSALSSSDRTTASVDFIQINPDLTYSKFKKERKYTNVGSALLNAIEGYFKNKIITVFPVNDSEKFYLKRGYKNISGTKSLKLIR